MTYTLFCYVNINRVFLILLLTTAIVGCITTDGKIIIDIREVKEDVKEKAPVISTPSPSTPEEICKKNVRKEMDIFAENYPHKLKSPTINDIKLFNNLTDAENFVLKYSLPYGLFPTFLLRSPTEKLKEPFYIAVVRWDLVNPTSDRDRVLSIFYCDINGSSISAPKVIECEGAKVSFRGFPEIWMRVDKYECISNIIVKVALQEELLKYDLQDSPCIYKKMFYPSVNTTYTYLGNFECFDKAYTIVHYSIGD